jgi:hypothetical protein
MGGVKLVTTTVADVSFLLQLNQINHTVAMALKYIVEQLDVDIVHIWMNKYIKMNKVNKI